MDFLKNEFIMDKNQEMNVFANNKYVEQDFRGSETDEEEEDDDKMFSGASIFAKIKPKPVIKVEEEPKPKFSGLSLKNLKLPKRDDKPEPKPKPTKKLSNLMNLGKVSNFSDGSDQETVSVADILGTSKKQVKPKVADNRDVILENFAKFFEINAKSTDKQLDIIASQQATIKELIEQKTVQQPIQQVIQPPQSQTEEDYLKKSMFLVQMRLEGFAFGTYNEAGEFIKSEKTLEEILDF